MIPHIVAYCLDWHIGQSKAFDELLVEPLKSFADIKLVAWDGQSKVPVQDLERLEFRDPLIFCQRPPSPALLKIPDAKLVWIPMWDNVALNWSSDEWWASLPKNLRVVSFSDQVACLSEAAGLPTLRLCYYKNPAEFDAVKWDHSRTLFYWNRTGLFGPAFLKKLCAALDVHELYFRGKVDPKITTKAAFNLPSKIGRTIVREVSGLNSQAEYFELLKRCNIYLAPRALEGVGLTFLEAMASGCAVFAYDAPTMNEYITHGVDGCLFPALTLEQDKGSLLQQVKDISRIWLKGKRTTCLKRVSDHQDWNQLKQMDLEILGSVARSKHETGRAVWKKQIADFARFILDW